jgi:hypothetical protein
MKSGVELIAIERQEQIEKHGRTTESDVSYNEFGQLAFAAVALASEYDVSGRQLPNDHRVNRQEAWTPMGWSKFIWNKMIRKSYKDRLIVAGALIAAEIDRLQNLNP